jgi:ethanolamine utilization protein EutN
MQLGRVIGTIWATKKYEALEHQKMQLLQPLTFSLKNDGDPIVVVDTIGAGPGEVVYYITSSEAVIPMDVDFAPVDAAIVGIVDSINIENK